MADILVFSKPYQSSSARTEPMDYFFNSGVLQSSSQACITDLTAPLFSGISGLSVLSLGQLRVTWAEATDVSLPIRYEVYIQASTATGLFNSSNIVGITNKLRFDTFTTADGSFLTAGVTYYVGVRALDGVSNRDSNTSSMSAVTPGITTITSINYAPQGAFSIDSQNRFRGTLWGLKNSVLLSGSMLGQASYQVYDKTGAAVSGMSEASLTADANGIFTITPVASQLSFSLDHYIVRINIVMDGAIRTGNIPIIEPTPEYEVHGVFSLDTSNNMQATFWATANEEMITASARLGTASYQVYDKAGVAVSGMSGTGIAADTNGYYKITPVASTLVNDLAHYVVRVTIAVDNVNRTNTLPIMGKLPTYSIKGAFSLSTSNQLRGTLWALRDNGLVTGGTLGTASYQIYDRGGSTVAMSESGITADSNGQFKITPVTSLLTQNLSHYLVKVSMTVDGAVRSDYIPIIERAPQYALSGVFAIDGQNRLIGSLWASADDQAVTDTSRLGTASYQIYDATGASVAMSQSGISANAQGTYVITPAASLLTQSLTLYTVAVTATVDGVTRTGSLPIQGKVPNYSVRGAFSLNSSNQLRGTLWALRDTGLVTGSALGTASYQIYDRGGNAIAMSESGIAADGNGQFKITPITSLLSQSLDHYLVKVSITVDGVVRSDYISIIERIPQFDINGAFSTDSQGRLAGTLWAMADDLAITDVSRLGTASYQVYDAAGAAVAGMSGSGVTANAQGAFVITPVTSTLRPIFAHYTVGVTITVDGISRSKILPIAGKYPSFECKGIFSINAANQFQATFWATVDGVVPHISALGTARYQVYDVNNNPVSGLNQTGITADSQGRYVATPVSATVLTDLTHYSVLIGITVNGYERVSYRGFTLLGN